MGMVAVALLTACAHPAQKGVPEVRVSVEGDDPVVAFVRARLGAAGYALAPPENADVRVRLRMSGSGAAHTVHVLVEDRRGVLVDRAADAQGDEADVAAWLAVRDAVERVEPGAPPPSTAPPRFPLPVNLALLAGAAPDVALKGTSFVPVTLLAGVRFDALPSVRVVVEAGYSAGISADAVLHSVPLRVGAEVHGGEALPVRWAAGARASTAPSLAVSGTRAGGGLGAAVAAYARAALPLGDAWSAVAEVGLESKLVRQAVLTDAGVHEEPFFSAPLSFGLEVRL